MVRITKVYTRTGDQGQTSLVGGRRVPKDHPRIEGYGTIDELNSVIGIARHFNSQKIESIQRQKLEGILAAIQQKLFDIGSELATLPGDEYPGQLILSEVPAQWLEGIIDTMNEDLGPLKSFILPGGTPLNAFLHQARTVCRRAERLVFYLHQQEAINPHILIFLNRLSDALFVFGRWTSCTMGESETLWEPGQSLPSWNSL